MKQPKKSAELPNYIAGSIHNFTVVGTTPEGLILAGQFAGKIFTCDLLQCTALPPLIPQHGDSVLVLIGDSDTLKGTILGQTISADAAANPVEIILAASRQLTLQCGKSAVILQKDGKVLTKGQDIVSHARRANRIKGSAVAIN